MQVGSGCDDGYLKPIDLSDLHRSDSFNNSCYENDKNCDELYSEICDVSLEHKTNKAHDNLSELGIRQINNSGVTVSSSTDDSTQKSCQQLLR